MSLRVSGGLLAAGFLRRASFSNRSHINYRKGLHSQSLFPETVGTGADPSDNLTYKLSIGTEEGAGAGGGGGGGGAGLGLEHLPTTTLGPLGSIFSNAPPVGAAQDLLTQLHDIPGKTCPSSSGLE
jgi:hypothetical protein